MSVNSNDDVIAQSQRLDDFVRQFSLDQMVLARRV